MVSLKLILLDSESFSKIRSFISEFIQNRNMVIGLNDFEKTVEKLKSYKDSVVAYLNMLSMLKSKINFGKDDYCLKLEFSWQDVLKKDYYNSYNVNYEYYSALFNLGMIYDSLGKFFINATDDAKLKEGIKYFQNAAWVFDKIKGEVQTHISSKELSPDLSSNYLTYCSYFCLAQAQTLLITVAERKKLAYELQAQLAKGVSDLYSSALNLAIDSLKKLLDEPTRIYLSNRKYYFNAISLVKMKEHWAEVFSKTGEGYGKQIAYLGLACECMNQAVKDINKISGFLDENEFMIIKSEYEQMGGEMYEKNNRIYHDPIPDLTLVPKVEKNIKVNPLQISDDLNKTEGFSSLDYLVPLQVKPMLNNYKTQMMQYISESLDKYENEAKINSFLSDLNLPLSLDNATSSGEIPESLWKRINEVQQKGGSFFLTNQISNLENKNEEIAKRLNDIELALYNEEEEDNKMRSLYGHKWVRLPSKNINRQYYNVLEDYKSKLNIAKNCDANIKQSVLDSTKYFDLLTLPKSSLEKKIPVKVESSELKNTEEAVALKKEWDELDDLKDKCMEIIDKIFQILNDDNIITQFLLVLQKKTTEKAILAENKVKYDPLFKELETLTNQISEKKNEILKNFETFNRIKSQHTKPNEENESFFKEIDNHIMLYNQKNINLNQGVNFYNEFTRKLNEINERITDYLLARDYEKNDLIKSITSGQKIMLGNYPQSEATYLDPTMNIITNMNYSYRYQPNQGKYYK